MGRVCFYIISAAVTDTPHPLFQACLVRGKTSKHFKSATEVPKVTG